MEREGHGRLLRQLLLPLAPSSPKNSNLDRSHLRELLNSMMGMQKWNSPQPFCVHPLSPSFPLRVTDTPAMLDTAYSFQASCENFLYLTFLGCENQIQTVSTTQNVRIKAVTIKGLCNSLTDTHLSGVHCGGTIS